MTDLLRVAPHVSVVISSYNRADALARALESIENQDTGDLSIEVVVVDNNSTDRTREVVRAAAARDPRIRYVFEPEQGVSHARNRGISTCRAPIIAFTDDDVHVASDWAVKIKAALDAHPEVEYIGGKVLPRWPQHPPKWLDKSHWAPLALADHGQRPLYTSCELPLCLLTANLACRASLFTRIGLFATNLQRVKDSIGSSEDHEIQLRIWHAGLQGLYVPDVVVHADVQPDRLNKRYHRRWHTGAGRYHALMRLHEHHDDAGRLSPVQVNRRIAGVPAYVYKHFLFACGRWCRAMVKDRDTVRFQRELDVRYLANYIYTTWTTRPHEFTPSEFVTAPQDDPETASVDS